MITIQDFAQTEMKIARIISVDDHPAADKLLVLRVDIGEESPRTLVAGLRGHYTAEELEGRLIVVVANLEPAKLRGVQSNGMLLAASDGEQVVLISPEKDLAPGSSIS
jgi:methionine--tRNA ligase beta chain